MNTLISWLVSPTGIKMLLIQILKPKLGREEWDVLLQFSWEQSWPSSWCGGLCLSPTVWTLWPKILADYLTNHFYQLSKLFLHLFLSFLASGKFWPSQSLVSPASCRYKYLLRYDGLLARQFAWLLWWASFCSLRIRRGETCWYGHPSPI